MIYQITTNSSGLGYWNKVALDCEVGNVTWSGCLRHAVTQDRRFLVIPVSCPSAQSFEILPVFTQVNTITSQGLPSSNSRAWVHSHLGTSRVAVKLLFDQHLQWLTRKKHFRWRFQNIHSNQTAMMSALASILMMLLSPEQLQDKHRLKNVVLSKKGWVLSLLWRGECGKVIKWNKQGGLLCSASASSTVKLLLYHG